MRPVSLRGMLLVAAAAIPMTVTVATRPVDGFFSGDPGIKVLQAEAFAHGRGWPRPIPYPARALDPELRFIPLSMAPVRGRPVSFFPFAYPLLAAPAVLAAGARGALLLSALAALAAALLGGRLALRLGDGGGWAGAAAGMLAATPLAFYGATFWEHTLAAALVIGAVACGAGGDGEASGAGRWLLAGLLLGSAAWVRTELLVLAPAVALPLGRPWGRRGRRIGDSAAAAAGLVLALAAGAAAQRLALGTWIPVHLLAHVEGRHVLAGSFLGARLRNLRNLLVPGPAAAAALLVWILALAAAVGWRRSRPRLAAAGGFAAAAAGALAALVAPALRVLGGMRPAQAFPVRSATACWLLLAALPLALADAGDRDRTLIWRRRVTGALAAWLVGILVLASPVDGGFQWGARFFLPALLLLTALLAASVRPRAPWRRAKRAAIAVVAAAAVLVQLFGTAFLVHVSRGNRTLMRAVAGATAEGEVVVTDTFYLPELAGPLWTRRRFMLLHAGGDLDPLLGALAAGGVHGWTFVSCGDAGLGVARRLGGRVTADGVTWVRTAERTREVAGRRLTVVRYREPPPPAR